MRLHLKLGRAPHYSVGPACLWRRWEHFARKPIMLSSLLTGFGRRRSSVRKMCRLLFVTAPLSLACYKSLL